MIAVCFTTTYLCQEHQKAWALNLNGFDVEEAKILRLSGKPQNAPEGWSQSLLRESCACFSTQARVVSV